VKMNSHIEDSKAEYESLIAELRKQLANEEYGSGLREKVIEKMQAEIQEAGTLCKSMNSELVSIRTEKNNLQEEYDKLINKQFHTDYQIENQKKIVEDINKTLERYEQENKAFRTLLALWI
jgi:chromosome segregation ATPase